MTFLAGEKKQTPPQEKKLYTPCDKFRMVRFIVSFPIWKQN